MEQTKQGCHYRTSCNFINLFNELLRSLSAWHCIENGFDRRTGIGATDDSGVRCLAILHQLLTRCRLGLGTPGTAAHEATVAVLGDAEGYQFHPICCPRISTSPKQKMYEDVYSTTSPFCGAPRVIFQASHPQPLGLSFNRVAASSGAKGTSRVVRTCLSGREHSSMPLAN